MQEELLDLDEIQDRLNRLEQNVAYVQRIVLYMKMAPFLRNGDTSIRNPEEIICARSTELTRKIAQRLEETDIEELDILMKLLKHKGV